MLIKEIKQALIGKVLSYYDGWNGSSDYFKIGYIKGCGSCISVYPEKGKGFGVIIPRAKALGSLFLKHTFPNS